MRIQLVEICKGLRIWSVWHTGNIRGALTIMNQSPCLPQKYSRTLAWCPLHSSTAWPICYSERNLHLVSSYKLCATLASGTKKHSSPFISQTMFHSFYQSPAASKYTHNQIKCFGGQEQVSPEYATLVCSVFWAEINENPTISRRVYCCGGCYFYFPLTWLKEFRKKAFTYSP